MENQANGLGKVNKKLTSVEKATLNILKNIIKQSLDKQGFPRSRNIKNLVFYLKLGFSFEKALMRGYEEYASEETEKKINNESSNKHHP